MNSILPINLFLRFFFGRVKNYTIVVYYKWYNINKKILINYGGVGVTTSPLPPPVCDTYFKDSLFISLSRMYYWYALLACDANIPFTSHASIPLTTSTNIRTLLIQPLPVCSLKWLGNLPSLHLSPISFIIYYDH